ncbi:hypothetical protein [Streptomyces flavofungini]|uniref:hypothetical protein n=1 Tax=Streptomyces flavofungini TaxID=68200 RepID=UPI0025AF509F|nr:hypothetical protein [Streptomyces flavofungini]WJV48936.1 hypothetical protein QUY26_27515 [Streptomyces flavofungini]
MNNPNTTQWWVTYREPNPAQMDIVAVEPAPEDDTARDERNAELERTGQSAYRVTAPDKDTAGDIAARLWSEDLVANPERRAAANAHIAQQ